MITFFSDFFPIFGKNGVFRKTNVMVIFSKFGFVFVLSQKRHFFAKFFGENI
jgi:hypothetical protein